MFPYWFLRTSWTSLKYFAAFIVVGEVIYSIIHHLKAAWYSWFLGVLATTTSKISIPSAHHGLDISVVWLLCFIFVHMFLNVHSRIALLGWRRR